MGPGVYEGWSRNTRCVPSLGLRVTTQHATGDVQKLWRDYSVSVRNCVDLSLLARTVDNARWKGKYSQPIALARLCEAYEELTLHKGKITRSNWERELTEAQQLCECAPHANPKLSRLTPDYVQMPQTTLTVVLLC